VGESEAVLLEGLDVTETEINNKMTFVKKRTDRIVLLIYYI